MHTAAFLLWICAPITLAGAGLIQRRQMTCEQQCIQGCEALLSGTPASQIAAIDCSLKCAAPCVGGGNSGIEAACAV